METITIGDLLLINSLSSRKYSDNKFLSNGSELERAQLKNITIKLGAIADYFLKKYDNPYGPFKNSISTGNPIAIGGINFKRVWSGIFKGNINKQYSVQISFVMNPNEACLDVGFYFGRASGHNVKDTKKDLEEQLKHLGSSLSHSINNNAEIRKKYSDLFDKGFKAVVDDKFVLPDEWLTRISQNPKSCQIITKIHPNDFGIIELSVIDYYVAEVVFLMAGIGDSNSTSNQIILPPLSPEQWAKRAERLCQIGLKGELYILELEQERIKNKGLNNFYPKHVALESSHHGFDILSIDDNGREIYIEVKSTTRIREDVNARVFYLSSNEYQTFLDKKNNYKLYRVYDVENSPNLEVLELAGLELHSDGYIIKY